jgi:hypothetical protein
VGRDVERVEALILWAATWVLGGIAVAMVLAILALLTWWSFIGDFEWVMLAFLGILAAFASISLRRKWRSS